jgi:Ni2+-binding GTPase involved in maturation of urease and hydrogenase
MELYIENGGNLWILCTKKMSAKGEEVYVIDHQIS